MIIFEIEELIKMIREDKDLKKKFLKRFSNYTEKDFESFWDSVDTALLNKNGKTRRFFS